MNGSGLTERESQAEQDAARMLSEDLQGYVQRAIEQARACGVSDESVRRVVMTATIDVMFRSAALTGAPLQSIVKVVESAAGGTSN